VARLSIHGSPRRIAALLVSACLVGALTSEVSPARATAPTQVEAVVAAELAADGATTHAGLVLNEAEVGSAVSGASYVATVSVRAAKPPVTGTVEITETYGSKVTRTAKDFTLSSTAWTTVSVTRTATSSGGRLGVNVRASDGVTLQVGSSTITRKSSSGGSSGTGCDGALPSGTAMGTSMSWDGRTPQETLAELDQEFGGLEAVRLFDPGLPASWTSARAKATAGRTVIISFRPMPADVLSGKYDAELKAFFTQAPSNQTIYWSYIHEPEPLIDNGTFTADQYRRAWQRIASFADAACKPNMHATLILTGWTADPGSKRSVSTYYAGDGVIDVIGWDPYNGVHDANRDYYPSASQMYANVVARSAEMGKPFAIAETGSRLVPGDSGAGRAAWLTEMGTYLRQHGAVYATYFNSTRDADWVLDDRPSQQAWAAQIDLG
jgi:hypothetical protein